MATTAGGLPYVESSDLISGYPTVSQALAEELDDQLAAKGDVAGETWTGTHDFTGATVTGAGALALITPTSIAYSGGSASSSGGLTTFSGVSSVTLNGIFSASYDNYLLAIEASGLTGNLYSRFTISGTATASGYRYTAWLDSSSGTLGHSAANNSAGGFTYSITGLTDCHALMTIFGPFATSTTFGKSEASVISSTNVGYQGMAVYHSGSTSFDGLFTSVDAGTLSGTIRVYGIGGA